MKQEEPFTDYIGYDLGGFMYNKKYPPNPAANGSHHHGYATDNQEAFFYDVALYLYGIKFTYEGHRYWIPSDGESWVLIDEDNGTRSESYNNPLDLIENASIDGKHLVDIVDEVQDIVMV
ncbi:MAG: hypothetical protein NC453_30935 [Muribaculum sp.]|nr:hypothetical protein [Muribaculum sp.]